MPSSEEWYRGPNWDEAAREEFERRLRRTHVDSRPQYLRIKAVALLNAGRIDDGAELLRRIVSDFGNELEAATAHEMLGDIARGAGRDEEALGHYRAAIALSPTLSSTTGQVHISLAELLIERGDFHAAIGALNTVPVDEIGLNSGIYRWNVAVAEAALGVGDTDTSAAAARDALGVLAKSDQFSRHPGLGRAMASAEEVARLRDLELRAARPNSALRTRSDARPNDDVVFPMSTPRNELERPIIADLAAVGINVGSVWDVVNTTEPYPQALPVLLAHLQRGGYPDRTMEGLARALAVKPMSPAWHTLRDLYLAAQGPDEEAGLAAAVAATATKEHVRDLMALVNDISLNDSRLLFLRPIKRLGGEEGRKFIEGLVSDPVFGAEAQALLRPRGRGPS